MNAMVLANALVVLPDRVVHGAVTVVDGLIQAVDHGPSDNLAALDMGGDLLIPGLVELHTDNLEKQLLPRPGVLWPSARAALLAHDPQLVAAGSTTVLDAQSCGQY
jgi:alpha-D-ribose 1-methylphosphonate 5-triphosphate diphosphatase